MPFRNRSTPHGFRSGGTRRKTQWNGTAVSAVGFQSVGTSSKVIVAEITAAGFAVIGTPLTLIWTRGQFAFWSDQIAGSEDQIGAFGIAIVSEQARAAGAASVLGPQINSDWDGWLFWHAITARMEFISAVGLEPHFATVVEIDSKAMRKVEDNMGMVIVAENASASTVFDLAINIRTLFKLH